MNLTEKQDRTLKYFQKKAQMAYEKNQISGKYMLEEKWRYEYWRKPYLLLASDEEIIERFSSIFLNLIELDDKGRISINNIKEDDWKLGELLTQIIEETNCRGILNDKSMQEIKNTVQKFYKNGAPLGCKIIESSIFDGKDYLFKYGKLRHLEQMLTFGHIRLCPASEYEKSVHIQAVKDTERMRTYRISALKEALEGISEIEAFGEKLPIANGTVKANFRSNDYYLFCTSTKMSRRMFSDFDADAVLVIKDKSAFISRLKERIIEELAGWDFTERRVEYFDPYRDIPRHRFMEFTKHFSYAYQNEHRIVINSCQPHHHTVLLNPMNITIGSLQDIAEILC